MSGSGGGGGGPIGPDPNADCLRLVIQTTLNSPDPDVVKELSKSDVLEIVSESDKGPIFAMTKDGKKTGSVTDVKMLQLANCIESGFSYVAVVLDVHGGSVDVQVRVEAQ